MKELLIYESHRSKVFVMEDEDGNGAPYILKLLNNEFPTPREVEQFNNEHAITQLLDSVGIRRVSEITKINNRHALKMEWFEGQTLKEAFVNKQNDIEDFLYIAIAICEVLDSIHSAGVIHKDINPSNILVNLQKRKIKFIDFGISSKFRSKKFDLRHPKHLQGTIAYCSPEQTGRMNRIVDYRSDLYSLGITFYTLLTGTPPFYSDDPLELIHAHIAKKIPDAVSVNPTIPQPLSDIIARLTKKNAEDRYQSAHGLKKDLEQCLNQLLENGNIEPFTPGQFDFISDFTLHEKLYGRETEIKTILEKFEESANGKSQLVLVSGYSGTGKTALVHETHKPITLRNGYYAEYKFDQFHRSTYSAFVEIFQSIIDLVLLEDKETLDQVSGEIQHAVGAEGKVLTDLLPNLENLIGSQPDVPRLAGEESQHRFNYLVQKFFSVLCTEDHPVVFFIDDLQWADASSLKLLHNLLTYPDRGYFLCLGAYRDNEVSEGHPLLSALTGMESAGIDMETIHISNLRKPDVQHLIGDALGRAHDETEIRDLADMVMNKTNGNAFFTIQFLEALWEEGHLYFDKEKLTWQWDADKIKSLNITENVVELMASKVLKLSSDTQDILKFAAALGNQFNLTTLSKVLGIPSENVRMTLESALKEGYLIEINSYQYKFAHDRIQQAVYSLLDENDRTDTHFKIGDHLHQDSKNSGSYRHIYDIVNHYNKARDRFESMTRHDRLELARLNLKAAMKAKKNSAFNISMDYLTCGKNLLPDDTWKNYYDLTLEIYRELAETSYLCGEYKVTEQCCDLIDKRGMTPLDRVKAFEVRINAFKAQNDLTSAINMGLNALQILGKNLPRQPTKLRVLAAIAVTEFRFRNISVEKALRLPVMTDPEKIEALRIMTNICPSAYWAQPNLIPVIASEMGSMTLKDGLNILSAWFFAGYGIIQTGVLGTMKRGAKFAEIGLAVMDKFETKEWTTQIVDPVYALIQHWNQHVDTTLEPLRDSFYTGLETGENEFACVNANIYCIHSFLCGKPLPALEKETSSFSKTFNQLKQETQLNFNEVYRQTMLCLMGENDHPTKLTGSAYDADKMLTIHQEREDRTGIFFIYFNKAILCCFFDQQEAALEHSKKASEMIDAVLAKYEIPNLFFYQALAAIGVLKNGNAQPGLLRLARKRYRKLKYFAKYAPENNRHKHLLIEAEMCLIQNNFHKARLLYDEAIQAANSHRFVHEEALAYELAGKAYHKNGYLDLARFYLNNAFALYRDWGAQGKTDHLLATYPSYFTEVKGQTNKATTTTTTITSTDSLESGSLDLKSLLKAATSMSGEVELPQLIRKLMKTVIENAGARKAGLILEKDGELLTEAVFDLSTEVEELLIHQPVDQYDNLPTQLIQYIKRTGRTIVSQTEEDVSRFYTDPYLLREDPQSFMALPIINQGKFVGILYLENSDTKNAFTQERVTILSMLSSQIAISIENAMLYQNLEKKVEERTEELEREKVKSDNLLFNILPREIAEELKETGITKPKYYESVTVLFADFAGFTRSAQKMSAEAVVNTIDEYFKAFDEIVRQHRLEKIKTIGDAYMCAGGLPVPNSTHAHDVIKGAQRMLEATEKINGSKKSGESPALEVRIGVHTGPLVAGVVGSNKFAYDIWGNTVNQASRLESNGEPGRINISEDTYQIIKNQYQCVERGSIEVKNLGPITMYFVNKEHQTIHT